MGAERLDYTLDKAIIRLEQHIEVEANRTKLEIRTEYFNEVMLITLCLQILQEISPVCYKYLEWGDMKILKFLSVYGKFCLSIDEVGKVWISAGDNHELMAKIRHKLIAFNGVKMKFGKKNL